jgi:hypothetical protein
MFLCILYVFQGDAVLFWDFHPDYTPDPQTLHAAEPVKAYLIL